MAIGLPADDVYFPRMHRRFEISSKLVVLIGCIAVLAVLVHAEGWIWPLKAAAILIPVSFLAS